MSFIKVINYKISGNMWVGSVIKITIILSTALASGGSATITIKDPSETEKVSDATMTEESDSVFSYTYNNSTSDDDGTYTATVTITQGSDTCIDQYTFTLLDSALTD